MTEITKSCISCNPRILDPFQALASISGISSTTLTFDVVDSSSSSSSSSPSIELLVESKNAFTNVTYSHHHRGYVAVAKALCGMVPEAGLWGEMGSGSGTAAVEVGAKLESWIETGVSALGKVAYELDEERVKDPLLKNGVIEFADSIERSLLTTSNTFLVGDTATAADVLLSFLLATACIRTGATLCQQTLRLIETVLNHQLVKKFLKVDVKGLKVAEDRKVEPLAAGKKSDGSAAPAPAPAPVPAPAPAPASASAPTTTTSTDTSTDTIGDYTPIPPTETSTNPILAKLTSLSLPYQAYQHKLSMTVEELVSNVPLPSTKHSHTKNLLLKDKKHGIFLVTAKSNANTSNTKAIGTALGLQGRVNLRLADGKTLDELLQVKPGCVGPLSVLNDGENKVTLVLDEGIMGLEKVHSHPLRNDWSVAMRPGDLVKACQGMGHEPVMISFEGSGGGGGGGGGDAAKSAPKKAPPKETKKAPLKQSKGAGGGGDNSKNRQEKKQVKKGETLLALQWKKAENFPMWYSDVIVLSEMIAYYDISGCYILRPWSYKIWELIQVYFNAKILPLGVENSYFPLFVSQDRLEKEKDHVEGFAPEVAWVTKSGSDDLAKHIAIRPTSETIMYPAFSDWIKSHRDLPLKLNQWSNVVRWEFKDPTPFLRSREFLWQEGHTAHATYEEADEMVMQALELYRSVYEDLLAVPVIKGYKTEKEKFAGGHRTTTVEAYIPGSGRAIQGATSHNLGQNFGKMFDIRFQDEQGKSQIAWQTSWGLTTRTIGVMIMVHGDDMGLVLPPRVAPLQIVIVPITSKKVTIESVGPYCEKVLQELTSADIRAKYDDRIMYNPGWKYNHWEQKGVPIRIEVGPRDIEQSQVRVVTRHSGAKEDMPLEGLGAVLVKKLEQIQEEMFKKVSEIRDSHVVQVTDWKDFVPNLEKNNLVLTPWIGGEHQDWEEWVKDKSREESLQAGETEDARCATSVAAKTLCIPFKQPELPEGTKCIASGEPATCWVLWGRSY